MIFYLITSIATYPSYLSYFNELAGGSSQGYKYLIDSNLDWGQDLPKLKQYLDENEIDNIYLEYFGQADPEHYGINYEPILTNGEIREAEAIPEGTYAISVSSLMYSEEDEEAEQYTWLLSFEPKKVISNIINIYEF